MANTSSPYRRVGVNSWGELLNKVNEELENPPVDADCEAIDPIPIPDPMHRWAKSDIREVHDKLNEMPEDCFTFDPIPDLWKIGIIQDIEDQLGESWCDCDEEQCCFPCPDCGQTSTTFLGTESVDANNCTECGSSPATRDACIDIQENEYDPARSDFGERRVYADKQLEWCDLKDELADLEEALQKLEDQLSDLQQQFVNCGNDVGCQIATQAQIDAKQIDIDDKETEIEDKQAEVDAANTEWMTAKSVSDGACARMIAAFNQLVFCDFTTLYDFVESFSEPIPPQLVDVCYDADDVNPVGPTPFCCERSFWDCKKNWALRARVFRPVRLTCAGFELPPTETGFRTLISGTFDIDGTPCPTNRGTSVCTHFHLIHFCSSTCCDCKKGNGICDTRCGRPLDNVVFRDYEMRITSPLCLPTIDCASGEPCG